MFRLAQGYNEPFERDHIQRALHQRGRGALSRRRIAEHIHGARGPMRGAQAFGDEPHPCAGLRSGDSGLEAGQSSADYK